MKVRHKSGFKLGYKNTLVRLKYSYKAHRSAIIFQFIIRFSVLVNKIETCCVVIQACVFVPRCTRLSRLECKNYIFFLFTTAYSLIDSSKDALIDETECIALPVLFFLGF